MKKKLLSLLLSLAMILTILPAPAAYAMEDDPAQALALEEEFLEEEAFTTEVTEEVPEEEFAEPVVTDDGYDELIPEEEMETQEGTVFADFFTALTDYATVENDSTYPFTVVDRDGVEWLASGNAGVKSSYAPIKITASSPIQVNFDWEISSESRYDYLEVKVNGNSRTSSDKASYSGNQTGKTYAVALNPGDILTEA